MVPAVDFVFKAQNKESPRLPFFSNKKKFYDKNVGIFSKPFSNVSQPCYLKY